MIISGDGKGKGQDVVYAEMRIVSQIKYRFVGALGLPCPSLVLLPMLGASLVFGVSKDGRSSSASNCPTRMTKECIMHMAAVLP